MKVKLVRLRVGEKGRGRATEWPSGKDITRSIPIAYSRIVFLPWFCPWIVDTFKLDESGGPYIEGDWVASERVLLVRVP